MEWNAQKSTTLDKIANLECSIKSIYEKIRSDNSEERYQRVQAASLTNNRIHNADVCKLEETTKSFLREEHENMQNLLQKINILDSTNKENLQMFKVELECLQKKIDNKNSTNPIYNPITADAEPVTILPIKRNLVKIIYPKGLCQSSKELAEYLKSKNINTDHFNRKSNLISKNKPTPPLNIKSEPFFRPKHHILGNPECNAQTDTKKKKGRKPNPNGKFPCPTCSNSYASKASLRVHSKTQHSSQISPKLGIN